MPAYVLLSRLTAESKKKILAHPDYLKKVRQVLEEWEANILADFHLLGKYNHCHQKAGLSCNSLATV